MAKVAKKSTKSTKSTKSAKSANKAVAKPVAKKAAAKKAVAVARKPNLLLEKLIALMLRKDGATIADFQTVDGFNIPSMAVVKAAQRAGYKADASKKPGERTRYIAKRA
jgi:ribosomal protein S12